jgi:hypothetical protein
MPAKGFLDLEEKKNLQKALKEEERGEVRERILMFLLLNDGKTQREIAEFIGCSLKTVGEHLTCAMSINAYSSQKLENLELDHKEK